jgi:hypothetical protein
MSAGRNKNSRSGMRQQQRKVAKIRKADAKQRRRMLRKGKRQHRDVLKANDQWA